MTGSSQPFKEGIERIVELLHTSKWEDLFMKKYHYFLVLIAIGIIGKWVVMPSVKTMKLRQDREREKQQKEVLSSCFLRGKCSVSELLSMRSQTGNQKEQLREYVLKNWGTLVHQSPKTMWYLKAQIITAEDINEEFISDILKLSKFNQQAFLQGLSHCHNRHCLDFGKKYYARFNQEDFYDEINLIRIKVPGHWSEKNDILKRLLDSYESSREFTKAATLIDFIPNHPMLKKFLEKHYLRVIGHTHIEKVALHLARYNPGWHDRNYKRVMKSRYMAHIDAFLLNMKVGCPQKLKEIFSYKSYWNEATLEIAKKEARYLFKEMSPVVSDLGLKKEDFIASSKCTEQRETAF